MTSVIRNVKKHALKMHEEQLTKDILVKNTMLGVSIDKKLKKIKNEKKFAN